MKKDVVLKIKIEKVLKDSYQGTLKSDSKLSVDSLESIKDWIVTGIDRLIEDRKKMESP